VPLRYAAILALLALPILAAPSTAEEISCSELLVQCGDGPSIVRNEHGQISAVGGGAISMRCVGIISGVLSSYKFCHGNLTWAGAGAVLAHFVHANPELLKRKAWNCAEAAYAEAFPCAK